MMAFLALSIVACEGDDDDDDMEMEMENEEELITDLILTFTDPDTQDAQSFTFSDTDGPGGNAPSIDLIELETDGGTATYNVSVQVQDASDPNDVEDITAEVMEEDAEHQFFYLPNAAADTLVSIAYNPSDTDDNGNPVGLETTWVFDGNSDGSESVRVVLRHEPNKDGAGVAEGDISNAGGESDIDVTFNLEVN
jgi:hypothetical protein